MRVLHSGSRAGFAFSGLEWGGECFCGHNPPKAEDKIPQHHCNLPCPLSANTCGGNLAIDVFYTGIRIVRRDFQAQQVDNVSIAFMMTVSGRSVRQVRRLLRQIYRPHHYYFIHVDQSSQWMFSQLKDLQTFPNIKLATQRFQTFWASNTLLFLLLTSMKDILELGWDFDYLVNISESDFPVRPLEQFEIFLRNNTGRNFVAMGNENMVKFQNGQAEWSTPVVRDQIMLYYAIKTHLGDILCLSLCLYGIRMASHAILIFSISLRQR